MRKLISSLILAAAVAAAPAAFAATTAAAPAKTAPAKPATPAQPSKKALCAKAWSKETNKKGGRKAYMKACLAKG